MNVGSIASGLADVGSVLYNHYYPRNKSINTSTPHMKNLGHYTKSGKKLAIYHKSY